MPAAPSLPVRHTLRPGQRGTQRYVAQYGERLVCVRQRFDAERQERVTTVELVVDRVASAPRAGGTWDAALKLWRLPAGDARRLGLAERIVRLPSESLHLATR